MSSHPHRVYISHKGGYDERAIAYAWCQRTFERLTWNFRCDDDPPGLFYFEFRHEIDADLFRIAMPTKLRL